MSERITVRGIEYIVEAFSDLHLRVINEMFLKGETDTYAIGGFAAQCNAAEVVKEVVCPDLPSEVISVTSRGKYIWQLSAVELPFLLLQIIRVFRLRQAAGLVSPAEIAENTASIESIEAYIESAAPQSMKKTAELPVDPQPEVSLDAVAV